MATAAISFRNYLQNPNNFCRTCLAPTTESNSFSIFDMKFGKYFLSDIITELTGVKIHYGDKLPSFICTECRHNAENAFIFKTKSQESDITIRDFFKTENDTNKTSLKQVKISVKTEQVKSDDDFDYLDEQYSLSFSNNLNSSEEVKDEGQCSESLEIVAESKERCKDIKGEDENTTCFLCNKSYKDLSKHMWESHIENMTRKKRGRPKLTNAALKNETDNNECKKNVQSFKCSFCIELCKTKEDFESHIIEHKDVKVLCCLLCKKLYINKCNFDIHLCINEKQEIPNLQNEEENKVEAIKRSDFVSEMLLQELVPPGSDLSGLSLYQICNACGRLLSSGADLICHTDAEHPELSLRCNMCNKVFATLKTAARHRSVCKEIKRNYACTTCGLKYAYEISLNKHILRHHEGQSVSVKFMDTKTKLNEKQYQCDTCNKCFYRKDLLTKHAKRHMPNETLYECDVCKKRFHRRDNLRSHTRVHEIHREKNPSNCLCLYCGRSFSNSSNLIVHMRRHTGEKPYKCDFCGKGFPRSSDLQCHRRSHTGEKPCICRVCGKGFSGSNKLSRHMRVHTGQRPYKCTYCDKAFSQSNDLTLHVRRHTGDKPYICEVCGERFIQGSVLHNHRRAHGHFPPTCETQVPVSFTYSSKYK